MKPERVFAGYLLIQGIGGVAFWVLLTSVGPVREAIELLPAEHAVTDSFVFADLFVGILGSWLGAYALLRGRRWAVPMVAFTAGGLVYPTFFLLGWLLFTGTGAVCLGIMLLPSLMSSWVAAQTWKLFRTGFADIAS